MEYCTHEMNNSNIVHENILLAKSLKGLYCTYICTCSVPLWHITLMIDIYSVILRKYSSVIGIPIYHS